MSTKLVAEMAGNPAGIKTDLKGTEKTSDLEVTNSRKTSKGAISTETVEKIAASLTEAMGLVAKSSNTFTPHDRIRLVGAGIKNWGFIQTAFSHAVANPQFVPAFLDMDQFKNAVDDFERKRILLTLIQQFTKIISDSMLNDSDEAYHDGIEYYNYVREAARQRVPGAEAEYKALKPYFKRNKRAAMNSANPNQAEFRNIAEG
ncbi:hypothetical protein [Leadbettera azotonutricia]|uniref:Uncharacterized protein n=1 Tax=Leadbettera azotonutricia (strain ATCC BAA-888 / DSM 13862 / ZAS-9) TaxID=545695 RepID=F5Y7H4_LEAAZ|nr:hypothetical protein [Leadbettera azotonutricia]AEF80434.1 hypothetical protein TREAZ_1106 [Leadbettera azotonutricia ZAS-9]